MAHIAVEQLENYSRNNLPLELLGAIEEHLLVCEECRTVLNQLEEEARIIRHALVYFVKPDAEQGR